VDGMKISPVSLNDLDTPNHHSIRLRIGVKPNAKYPGGVNIFGRGFGNYDQDIVLRIHTTKEWPSNAGPALDGDRKIAGLLVNGG
jgi:predicted transcriptional regulator